MTRKSTTFAHVKLATLVIAVASGCHSLTTQFDSASSDSTDLYSPPLVAGISARTNPNAEHSSIILPSVAQHNKARGNSNIRLISHDASDDTDVADQGQRRTPSNGSLASWHTGTTGTVPIDLANALAMGGGSHLDIRIARQRVIEAQTAVVEAKALWLPSLRFGIGWNKHDGRLQETQGNVLEVSRNSLFVGGGGGLGNIPLAAGSSGPARLMVNLSLADTFFEPRIACCLLQAERSASISTYNDSLLAISIAYFDLLETHGLLANANVGLAATEKMVELTTAFEREGAGNQSDVDRAKTEFGFWQQTVEDTKREAARRSAELARLLRLSPQSILIPVEEKIAPLVLVDPSSSLTQLITRGLTSRPELAQHRALVQATCRRMNQEHWRPWLPHVQAGASGGSFGGGPGSDYQNDGSRSDVDLMAFWELRGLGIGNRAAYGRRVAQMRQTQLRAEQLQEQIIAEIVVAARDTESYSIQTETALERVAAAGESHQLNLQRVSDGEGLPIELLQAIRARVGALDAHTRSAANLNRAQYRLYRSLGRPPEAHPGEPDDNPTDISGPIEPQKFDEET